MTVREGEAQAIQGTGKFKIRQALKGSVFVEPFRKVVDLESYFSHYLPAANEQHGRQFDNGRVRVTLQFDGQLRGRTHVMVPPEHWTLWVVTVENILHEDGLGEPYPEPRYVPDGDGEKRFRTPEEAAAYYEQFLVQFGGCFGLVDEETGEVTEFRERGNKLEPEEPEQVVKPGVVASETMFGSW